MSFCHLVGWQCLFGVRLTFCHIQIVLDAAPVEPQLELSCERLSLFACNLSLQSFMAMMPLIVHCMLALRCSALPPTSSQVAVPCQQQMPMC